MQLPFEVLSTHCSTSRLEDKLGTLHLPTFNVTYNAAGIPARQLKTCWSGCTQWDARYWTII